MGAPILAKAIFSLRAHNPDLTFFLGVQERETFTVKEFCKIWIGAGCALHLGPLPHMVDWNCQGQSVDSSLGADLLQSECAIADIVLEERRALFFFLHILPDVGMGQSSSSETKALSRKIEASWPSCFVFCLPYCMRES